MGHTGCEEIALWFTSVQAGDEGFRQQLRGLLGKDEPPLAEVATFIGSHEPRLGLMVRDEFETLPRPASLAILRAWCDAVDMNVPFKLVSEGPDRPLSFARRRLVRVVTDVEQSGITVRLSHVPGHHPVWDAVEATGSARPAAVARQGPCIANPQASGQIP
jgi:hypothetical protein